MYDADENSEFTMRTRKKRRNYKCLEDGKEETKLTQRPSKHISTEQPRHVGKDNIISIDTNNFKPAQKDTNVPDNSDNEPESVGGKTSGRWTSEEHRKFVEALKLFGKQWKKVEDHIKTRSGAQIRSHAQKYFLKIQKEYPDQDSFEVFKSKTPEFLEDTIFMKKKGDSDDDVTSNWKSLVKSSLEPMPQVVQNPVADQQVDFAQSVTDMLAKKREITTLQPPSLIQQQPQAPSFPPTMLANNDLIAIKSFFDHIKNSLGGSYIRNQGGSRYATSEGKLLTLFHPILIFSQSKIWIFTKIQKP